MSETAILQSIRLSLSNGAVRLFRNNVGAYQDRNDRWVQYGLAVGSSDLIGWRSVTITPEMVGQQIAQFTAIECKTQTGRVTVEQAAFISIVQTAGGVAGIARSVQDARRLLEG